MRVLIRDKKTGFYFKEHGCWLTTPEAAVDFETSLNALAYCDEYHLNDVEIVLQFGERSYDIRLPIALHRISP